MKNILVSMILSLLSVSLGYAQTEMEVARRWLIQKGAPKAALRLSPTERYDELMILEDAKSHAFAIVASETYASQLDSRVLAYSVDNVFSNPEGAWNRNLVNSYRQQLRTMKSKGLSSSATEASGFLAGKPMKNTVLPLLGQIRWGQAYPFNQLCPASPLSGGHKLAGCVAIAMSQVMQYYQYPSVGSGHFAYTMNGKVMKADFSSVRLDWKNMASAYSQVRVAGEDGTAAAQLVRANAIAVSSVFGDLQTSSSITYARAALVNFWGYSSKCNVQENVNPRSLESMVRRDLDAGCPVILSGGEHAFVCDGCDEAYLHFNLGWYGAGNGYYRLLLSPALSAERSLPAIATSLVHDIVPARNAGEVRKVVAVATPGTLHNLLPEGDAMKVTSLKVNGKLDGADVLYLRRMLGADDAFTKGKRKGILTVLDLSGAEFVNDKANAYTRMSASDCRYEGYDFSIMNADLFKKFRRTNMAKGTGYKFEENAGEYYVDFYTVSKAVSPMMFAGCQNLREIHLPYNTNRVYERAFFLCNSLEYVTLPSSVDEVAAGAFANCYLLRRVITENAGLHEALHGLSPVKTIGHYGDVKDGKYSGGVLSGNDTAICEGLFLKRGTELVRITALKYSEFTK